jgi:hypothetical protein
MYLSEIEARLRTNPAWGEDIDLITEKSLLFEQLRHLGYQVVAFADPYELVDISSAEVYLSPGALRLSQFQNDLLAKTPLPVVLNLISVDAQFDQHRQAVQFFFKELGEVPQIEAPTITFAHILFPHPPFIYDAAGKPVEAGAFYSIRDGDRYFEPQDRQEYTQAFVQQTIYANQRTLETLDRILQNSTTPPIIVLQSDHGPASLFDPFSLENTVIDERTGILAAYYFPDGDYTALYPEISPVNSFRIILNQYFGAEYALLPDASYFSPFNDLLGFVEVK